MLYRGWYFGAGNFEKILQCQAWRARCVRFLDDAGRFLLLDLPFHKHIQTRIQCGADHIIDRLRSLIRLGGYFRLSRDQDRRAVDHIADNLLLAGRTDVLRSVLPRRGGGRILLGWICAFDIQPFSHQLARRRDKDHADMDHLCDAGIPWKRNMLGGAGGTAEGVCRCI